MYYIFGQRYRSLKSIVEAGLSLVPLATLKHRVYKQKWHILNAISTPPNQHPQSLELRIVDLASYGKYTHKQIAEIVGTNPKFVENTLTKLKYQY